jgi:hypothetical protein
MQLHKIKGENNMAWSSGTFTRTNGVHTGSQVWQEDAAAGTKIRADRHDVQDQDIATGINTCLTKDGQNTPTANLPMGGFKHTGIADGSARNQYPSIGQIQDGGLIWLGTIAVTGTVTATATPAITAYVTGQTFRFIASGYSTSSAWTLNINSIGAKSVKYRGATLTYYGQIDTGNVVEVTYNGTDFIISSVSDNNLKYFDSITTGAANSQVIDLGFNPASYILGQKISFIAGFTNTAALTLTIGTTPFNVIMNNGANVIPFGVTAGRYYEVLYNGTNLTLLNPSEEWQTWTITNALAQGGGTWTSVAGSSTFYRYTVDGSVEIRGKVVGTTAGTVTGIYVDPPVVNASGVDQAISNYILEVGVRNGGTGLIDTGAGGKLYFAKYNNSTFSAGANSGFVLQTGCKYRLA